MFHNDANEFVFIRTYARYLPEQNRRETWVETVERYVNFITKHRGEVVPPKVLRKIKEKILKFDVMPSMRFLWTAGPTAERDNTVIYNCSFVAIDSVDSFAEALFILMCGTGVGFSVQKKYIEKLPTVPTEIKISDVTYVVDDSKEGWANSVKELINSLYNGYDINMDYSQLRPEGAPLKTMGGRASGPAPLIALHNFIKETFKAARGRKLNELEVHDIICQIGEAVVVGGVRRSSEISLSDLDSELLRNAKVGNFPVRRYLANNSAVYETKPNSMEFLKEWSALALSGTGERGIFNLESAKKRSPSRRNADLIVGTNPCGEILLRDKQFCNLSEIVVRPTDDLDDLLEKVETAVWMGAIQSTFTYFPYLRPEWQKNCEEERLLGVSITGQMDAPHLLTPEALKAMKTKAIKVAKKAAQILKINVPAAITCVKPSGTVSQVVESSSGMHPRFSRYYLRRYRISATDPLCKLMQSQEVPLSPENGQTEKAWKEAEKIYQETNSEVAARAVCSIYQTNQKWSPDKVKTWVVAFPFKSPEGSLVADELSAIEQLEWYKKLQMYWCEHNTSVTIYVKPDEWVEVGNWVYNNWEYVGGVSFLPYSDHKYEQAPYEAITKEKYEALVAKMKKIDYSQLYKFEQGDNTEGAKSYACLSGVCELI